MDFKQLEAFVVVADELHFANAAKRLHVTASALTRQIQRLEQGLSAQLLLRNNKQVELTPAGMRFLSFAVDALEREQALQRDLANEAIDLSGKLSIYSSVTASYGLLSSLLKDFRQNYPHIDVKLHTGDQAVALSRVEEGLEDLSIAAMPEKLPGSLAFKTLIFSKLCFIMPRDAGMLGGMIDKYRDDQSAKSFSRLPMIISEEGLARQRFASWFKVHGLEPNIYAEVSGHEAIVSMVALGMGIGLVPEIVIQHSPLQGKITIIEEAPELQAFQIGLCTQKKRLDMPAVKAFWQAAKA